MLLDELKEDLRKVAKNIRRQNYKEAIELLEKWVDIPKNESNFGNWPSKEKLYKWYHKDNLSLREVGNKVDKTAQAVMKHFDKIGIETRDPHY